jgi:hypothetical protein
LVLGGSWWNIMITNKIKAHVGLFLVFLIYLYTNNPIWNKT